MINVWIERDNESVHLDGDQGPDVFLHNIKFMFFAHDAPNHGDVLNDQIHWDHAHSGHRTQYESHQPEAIQRE